MDTISLSFNIATFLTVLITLAAIIYKMGGLLSEIQRNIQTIAEEVEVLKIEIAGQKKEFGDMKMTQATLVRSKEFEEVKITQATLVTEMGHLKRGQETILAELTRMNQNFLNHLTRHHEIR